MFLPSDLFWNLEFRRVLVVELRQAPSPASLQFRIEMGTGGDRGKALQLNIRLAETWRDYWDVDLKSTNPEPSPAVAGQRWRKGPQEGKKKTGNNDEIASQTAAEEKGSLT